MPQTKSTKKRNKRAIGKARNDTSGEKRTEDRYRELKKRYMKVCRENAKLRRELQKYINLDHLDADIGFEPEPVDVVIPTCKECLKGDLKEIKLPQFTLVICQNCGHKTKKKHVELI